MITPVSWLKDYVDIPDNIKAFADNMTLSGTKVESVEYRAANITGIITAKVTAKTKHADYEKLWIIKVNDTKQESTVVTAAQNVNVGDIVPFATIGAVIASGQKINTVNFGGITSEGMLCSAAELGINSSVVPKFSQEGIFILPQDTPVGVDIIKALALDDYIIDFELTNNRQDCNSILGIAYEASATYGKKFDFPMYEFDNESQDINKYLSVEVKNFELCPRYTAKMVEIIRIEPSPLWMQTRLMAAGVRPINNVVDVSNFVMIETGQPLHTFDYDKLEGGKIIVENANDKDNITTLDHVERNLDKSMLMINDAAKHAAIAGVMGGGTTDIDENTKLVVIESANFNKNSIRATAKKLGLRTESSSHFEKGISVNLTKYAADRAASLLVEIGAAKYINGVIDVYKQIPPKEHLSVNTNWFNKFAGIKLSVDHISELLYRLGFEPKPDGDDISVTVPRFRNDIKINEDLAEEIIRMYGYDNIPLTLMDSSNYISEPNRIYEAKQNIKNILVGMGGFEILTYSFVGPQAIDRLAFNENDKRRTPVKIINPLGEEYSVMRTSMLAGMLDTLALNYNRKNKSQLMFELANIYLPESSKDKLPLQQTNLVIGKYNSDYYEMKAVINALLAYIKTENVDYVRSDENFLHPGRSADIYMNNIKIGYVGQIHPLLAKTYDITDETIVAEINADILTEKMINTKIKAKAVAKYPPSERDLALIIDDDILAAAVQEKIIEYGGKDIISCKVFDVYKSPSLGEGKKSLAFNLVFRSDEKTLTDEQVDEYINDIIRNLEAANIAKLRF